MYNRQTHLRRKPSLKLVVGKQARLLIISYNLKIVQVKLPHPNNVLVMNPFNRYN